MMRRWGAGGLIAKLRGQGVPVTVVAVTDGENAYEDAPQLREVRVLEQEEALGRLGVSKCMIHRLQLPDRDVSAYENPLVDLLLPFIEPGIQLIAPWPHDFHPDHEAVGRAAARIAKTQEIPVSYYLFWTWHRGTVDLLEGLALKRLALSDSEHKAKLHALEAYASQYAHSDGEPILSEELLLPARRSYEVYIQ